MKTIIWSISTLLVLASCDSAEITEVPETINHDPVENEFVPVQQADSICNMSPSTDVKDRSIIGKDQKIPMH